MKLAADVMLVNHSQRKLEKNRTWKTFLESNELTSTQTFLIVSTWCLGMNMNFTKPRAHDFSAVQGFAWYYSIGMARSCQWRGG